jgi:hypothetical protein
VLETGFPGSSPLPCPLTQGVQMDWLQCDEKTFAHVCHLAEVFGVSPDVIVQRAVIAMAADYHATIERTVEKYLDDPTILG